MESKAKAGTTKDDVNSGTEKRSFMKVTNVSEEHLKNRKWWKSQQAKFFVAPILLSAAVIPLMFWYYNGSVVSVSIAVLDNVFRNGFVYCIFSIGAAIVIASGSIDISSVGIGTLSGVIFAITSWYLNSLGSFLSVTLSVVLILMLSSLSGLATSYAVTNRKAPAMIFTWAIGSLYGIIAVILTRIPMKGVRSDPGNIPLPEGLMVNRDAWTIGHEGFWYVAFFLVAVYFIIMVINLPTQAAALGASETSANYAGLSKHRIMGYCFVTNAVLSACAGIFQAFYLTTASTNDFRGHELVPIAIAILGGTSLTGGYISIWAVVFASAFWAAMACLGPLLPQIFPFLGQFEAQIGEALFFIFFLVISAVIGGLLAPPVAKILAKHT